MKEVDDGGPAFPLKEPGWSDEYGMSLRDHFAGLALQGICASGPTGDSTDAKIACEAYNLADAMIKARKL
jgi:hypothetical protein